MNYGMGRKEGRSRGKKGEERKEGEEDRARERKEKGERNGTVRAAKMARGKEGLQGVGVACLLK